MNIKDIRTDLMQRFAYKTASVSAPNKKILSPIRTAADLQGKLIGNETKDKTLKDRLSNAKMDKEWYDRVKESQWWMQPTSELLKDDYTNAYGYKEHYPKNLLSVRDRILEFGGDAVCLPIRDDEDALNILEFGQLWPGINARMMKGEPCQCHANSCELWALNKDDHDIHICTGFALSQDGMWREHSWLIRMPSENARLPQIIETTEPRLLYYGYVLDDYRATKFYYDQIDSLRIDDVTGFKEPENYDMYLDTGDIVAETIEPDTDIER